MESDGESIAFAHAVLDHVFQAFRERARNERPVWEDPAPVVDALRGSYGRLPIAGAPLAATVHFLTGVLLQHPVGNTDPRFLGWVHGGGDELGIGAAMIMAGMNSNTGGRDHGAVHVEATVLEWVRRIFGFPDSSSGVFTQGTSEANLLALAVARTSARNCETGDIDPRCEVVYVASDTHDSVMKAARLLQYGHVRQIPGREGDPRIDPDSLARAVASDRAEGLSPVCVVASAGTIDRGICDDLRSLAEVAREARIWLHIDGAFGAWLRIAPPPFDEPVAGIEFADSLAFDFHKWLPSPFAAGALLVRDRQAHRATFSTAASYLSPSDALAGGPDWAVNYGVALSRPFQGLAPYLVLRTHGLRALGQSIAYCVVLANYFADRIECADELRLVVPVEGNVVLFEAIGPDGVPLPADDVAASLQRRGRTVFSTTEFDGRRVLRACFVNHRTRPRHVDEAIDDLLDLVGGGRPLSATDATG
jgi:aromatic-L-amino-acid decarboxylase